MIEILVSILSMALGVAYLRSEKRRSIQAWCDAAREAGLEDVAGAGSFFSTRILSARKGSRRVFVVDLRPRMENPMDGSQRVRLTIEGSPGITLRAEDMVREFERYTGPRETELGDVAFDREVYVHGTPERLRAALDSETRRILRPLLKGRIAAAGAPAASIWAGVTIRDGDIVAEFGANETAQLRRHFPAALKTLLEAASCLAPPENLATRIIENTREEPEWQVRLENVRLLAHQFARHPATPEALQRACHDEDQEVQLEAALGLGPDTAEATLREIACAEHSADPLAARAIAALDRRMTREQLKAVLNHALRTRRVETARTCLVALGTFGGPLVVEQLAKVLALHAGELAVVAARALGASRAPSAEAPLLTALRGSASDVRVAAAEALGRVGGAGAVLPLREIASQNRLDTALRKAARESIAEIQSRLSGASPGQLSIAQGQGGEVSLAGEDPQGRLSVPEDAQ
jgi:HEAT repeat protein